jgi:hypothetical protein
MRLLPPTHFAVCVALSTHRTGTINHTITMLALKKKKEAAAAAAAAAGPDEPPSAPKVSLLGIGGKKTSKSSDGANGSSKKRTPGEIRIQKGTQRNSSSSIVRKQLLYCTV